MDPVTGPVDTAYAPLADGRARRTTATGSASTASFSQAFQRGFGVTADEVRRAAASWE